ncbi:restriction endonuclease [Streptomyces rimosus]|uniref:restriction endonuclease n=1 Tax=Streptomyces rimosus TaxID=1927 RepID=UPI0004C7E68D|nr:restriction endonuclease [Streptomyces rimosus]
MSPGSGARAGARAYPMRRTVFVLAVIGALLCGGFLAVREVARWAVAHPGPALGVGAVVLPLLVALAVVAVRGMPRLRELRRAARAGKAEAEAEVEVAAMAEAAPVAKAGPVVEVEAADLAPWRVEDFLALDADGFEQAIARLCERDGCRDVQVVGGAGDLGADVLATASDGRRIIIQCKRYGETNKVGSQDVQRFGGTCFTVHEAEVAAVVTTSTFTEPAADYAATCGIRCYDGERLVAWANGNGAAPWG